MTIHPSLTNFGFLLEQLPTDLYRIILNESKNLDKNEKTYSGLSGPGVPDHYYLSDNTQAILNNFISYIKDKYFSCYPEYIKTFRCLSKDRSFVSDRSWFNLQKKHEFIPNHIHDGVLSYTIWVNIPETFKKQSKNLYTGCFEITYPAVTGHVQFHTIQLDKTYEGKILMFPSSIPHCVYPFYDTEEYRISLSGNILFDTN